jgi:CHAT domain-containing protein
LRVEDTKRWLGTEWRSKKKSGLRKLNDNFLDYLTWLWHNCVEGILDCIHTVHKEEEEALPHVWWVGCGLASSMPFHAAGIHAHASRENTFSRALSSYTPSIKALGYARSQLKQLQDNQTSENRMLITLMPTTPNGANDKVRFRALKGVSEEQDEILGIVSSHLSTDVRIAPSSNDILDQLEKCQISHFACHGVSDATDPSSSGLVLQRIAIDGSLEQDYLSVYRISQLRLEHAWIAYLSACSTAENKGTQLRDEVIHIVSSFQIAGFPHVVGSLWPAGDEECVQVASGFYSRLFGHGSVQDMGGRAVASALQDAVMTVRAHDPEMPLDWAQFVHFGV